jgi:hypothetical protein
MTEDFLQFIWRYGLFERHNLFTGQNEKVEVIRTGEFNFNSGPDFLNARIKIGNTTWAGNVEIHVRSSDWYRHNHHADKSYGNVILQAVYENDREVMIPGGQILPTVKMTFDDKYYLSYRGLMGNPHWVPCFSRIKDVMPLLFESWISSLVIERLQQKAGNVSALLKQNHNDWDETFYIHFCRSFGAGVNGLPFEMLARSLPLRYIEKHRCSLFSLRALLLGQAGFPGIAPDIRERELLQAEYEYMRAKYGLNPMEKHLWKYLRTRPANFPDVRITQLAGILCREPRLLSSVLECRHMDDFHRLLHPISNIGEVFSENLVINCFIPFIFIYGHEYGKQHFKQIALEILYGMKPEKNRIVKSWAALGIVADCAFHSQGLIQITNNYCIQKRCLSCTVGNKIITL